MNDSCQMTFLASIKEKGKFCDGPVYTGLSKYISKF